MTCGGDLTKYCCPAPHNDHCCPPNTTFTEGAKGWCCYGPDQTCCNGSCVSSCYILEITEEYIGSCVCGIDGSETCKSNDLEVRNDGFGKELNFYYTCINAPLGQSGLTRCVPNGCTSTLFEAWICKDEMSQVGILACWELNMLFCSLQCSAAATACGSGQHRIVYNYFEDSGRIKKREVISVLDARFGKPIENDIFDIATEFGDYEIIDNRSISPN
jgi:hypothetical protein